MLLATQGRLIGPPAAALCCDQCRLLGVGTHDELTARDWVVQRIDSGPHLCPDCARVCDQPASAELARSRAQAGETAGIPFA